MQRIQKVDDTDGNVLIFGAHVANLLIQRSFQMIGQGQNQVLKPFVERFEGSLLFVDISGFTALSRRLHVESLKIHINAYFTLMLDVVDKHDGDVVKFAGDALFIIWPANSTNDLASCVQKALNCSLEITSVCDSYKINFDDSGYTSPSSSSPKDGSSIRRKPSGENSANDMFLNVHVGLSVGTMAAVDVGCAGRWEMLLIGQPLIDVAAAEMHAMSGEVVITGGAHAVLTASGVFIPSKDQTGTMFCESRSDNCYVVWTNFTRFDSSMDDEDTFTTTAPRNRLDFVDGILREIYAGIPLPKPDFAAWKLDDFQTQGKVFTMILIKARPLRLSALHVHLFVCIYCCCRYTSEPYMELVGLDYMTMLYLSHVLKSILSPICKCWSMLLRTQISTLCIFAGSCARSSPIHSCSGPFP
jgi:class 3 adenylate cyclase